MTRRVFAESPTGFCRYCADWGRTFKVNNRHALTITPCDLGFAVFLWYFSPNCTRLQFPTALGKAAL